MKTVKNKLKKQGGFTLVEMLTVVAIIAILIAISIPMVTGALERAAQATDSANIRAAKAEMSIVHLTNTATGYTAGDVMAYDAPKGLLTKTNTASIGKYGKASGNTDNILYVAVYHDTATGADVVCYQWDTPKDVATITKPTDVPADNATSGWKTVVPTF